MDRRRTARPNPPCWRATSATSRPRLRPQHLYAALPRAYGAIDRTKALIFADHAGVALGAAEAREDAALSLDIGLHRIDDLIAALGTREIIGQAEGILIERRIDSPAERVWPNKPYWDTVDSGVSVVVIRVMG